jgi:hypothetical protein
MPSLAGPRTLWLGVVVSALSLASVASAGTVDIFSTPGTGSNNISGTNIGIPVSPAWAVPTSSQYEWISYGETGCNSFNPQTGMCTAGPQNPVATTVGGTPTAIFYQTFVITDALDSGFLYVWADDTAAVYIDPGTVTSGTGSGGTLEWAANPVPGSNCANGPIGCLQNADAQIALDLPTGTYTLVIDAYQLVSYSPFGVMYDAVLTNTPEPSTYMLMGLGLAGLGTLIRRLKRS